MTQTRASAPSAPAYATARTVADFLALRATHEPERRAYVYLSHEEKRNAGHTLAELRGIAGPGPRSPGGPTEEEPTEHTLSYRELHLRAARVSARLRDLDLHGKRVLLIGPNGLEYLCAFLGTLCAGAAAVPADPPLRSSAADAQAQRLDALARHARPTVVLSPAHVRADLAPCLEQLPHLRALPWLASDEPCDGVEESHGSVAAPDDLALIQYTSGSTALPKGVMVSHDNLLRSVEITRALCETSDEDVLVSWLSLTHAFGLIVHALHALYLGAPLVFMDPAAFVQQPLRWLRALSRYRGTFSGAPNFAYDRCVQRITDAQRDALDLSAWSTAVNGGEAVRVDSMERFAARFAACGFRREAFSPQYGCTEGTAVVTSGVGLYPSAVRTVRRTALENGQVIEATMEEADAKVVPGVGRPGPGHEIVIAAPQTGALCAADEVGEIWLSGPTVAKGYWDDPLLTSQTFGAHLADAHRGPFVRTGDLGFLHDGNLYIAGRLKDLVIVRGAKHYPLDLEQTVERAHSALSRGHGAVFSVEIAEEERVVVLQAVDTEMESTDALFNEIFTAIRLAMARGHGLDVYTILLLRPGSIPMTKSGKLFRRGCQLAFMRGELSPVATWQKASTAAKV